MSARKCFSAKIRAGKVGARAGKALLDLIDEFEREHGVTIGDDAVALRHAAIDAATHARADAVRQADLVNGAVIAQANVLRAVRSYEAKINALRTTKGDFGFSATRRRRRSARRRKRRSALRCARSWRAIRGRLPTGRTCTISPALSGRRRTRFSPTRSSTCGRRRLASKPSMRASSTCCARSTVAATCLPKPAPLPRPSLRQRSECAAIYRGRRSTAGPENLAPAEPGYGSGQSAGHGP